MEESIKLIQSRSLKILTELIDIFEENNLTYYLSGGSFLGAVRHNGFIPWDDDIDISMPRRDYDKFLQVFSSNLPKYFRVQNFKTDSEYRYFITRILDTNFVVEEIRTGNTTHPAVDILPLDGSPNNSLKRKIYYLKILSLRYLISFGNRDIIDMKRKRSFLEGLVVRIVKNIPFEKIINTKFLKYRLENSMKKYDMDNSVYSGCLMGAYRTKQMVPTKWFSNGKNYKFENRYLCGPVDFDKYLKQMYGDYMKIPDQTMIDSKIHYKIKGSEF